MSSTSSASQPKKPEFKAKGIREAAQALALLNLSDDDLRKFLPLKKK